MIALTCTIFMSLFTQQSLYSVSRTAPKFRKERLNRRHRVSTLRTNGNGFSADFIGGAGVVSQALDDATDVAQRAGVGLAVIQRLQRLKVTNTPRRGSEWTL